MAIKSLTFVGHLSEVAQFFIDKGNKRFESQDGNSCTLNMDSKLVVKICNTLDSRNCKPNFNVLYYEVEPKGG